MQRITRRAPLTALVLTLVASLVVIVPPRPRAQSSAGVSPTSITVSGGPVCAGGSQTFPVSITLPPASIIDKVDVFFLFDDTGSFAGFVPGVTATFSGLVPALETAVPGVSFGFGVGRFEDYGGPGTGFSSESVPGRPFTLNQPIVTAATAGGNAARDALINAALARTAPGFGGDGPESAIGEGLFQTATGAGFDGDGNGSNLDSGNAGDITTQTAPGASGDVPAFSSNVATTSGTGGGVGWRGGSLRLVILATDISPVAAFPAGAPIPATISGAGSSTEPVTAFASSSIVPGADRFGFVSDSKTSGGNTVAGAVAPAGAATVQGTINALNAQGIRVLGMGPGAAPTNAPGPSFSPSIWLSAVARLTGAVDSGGQPLVFSTSVPPNDLRDAIVDAITTTTTLPVDVSLSTTALPPGLSFSFSPAQVDDVPPGGTASFNVTLTGDGTPINGTFDLNFIDVGSGAVLGTIPVTLACPTNRPPVAQCQNVTVSADASCRADANIDNGSFDPDGDPITLVQTPAGPYPLGSTSVTLTVTDDEGLSSSCSAVVTVVDNSPPAADCIATTNPAGKNIPPATNQNPDGFYQLRGGDNCLGTTGLRLFVQDTGSSFVAGPFADGDKVKITQAPGTSPNQKPMAGDIVSHLKLKGDAMVYAVDGSGNRSAVAFCRVPPKPR